MIKEACVENFTNIPAKLAAGADRIELCDNLAVGGTTVSIGVLEQAQAYCSQYNIPIMSLIRPRGGNFVYTEEERKSILTDIIVAKQLGVHGVVIGALTREAEIDIAFMEECLHEAVGLDVTFHMAFDAIAPYKQLEAIDWLAVNGFRRILTHGGPQGDSIEMNTKRLQQYISYADGRIVIMPGGGVSKNNLLALARALPTNEFHGTKIV